MATPNIQSSWRSTAAGAIMGLSALAPSGLAAQETTPVAYTQPVVTETMQEQETREGIAAIRGAAGFARSCETCVGIVFSKGDDFRKSVYDRSVAYLNERDAPLTDNNMDIVSARVEELLLQHYQDEYTQLFAPMGVQAEIFEKTKYASSEGSIMRSGVVFHVGQVVFEDPNGQSAFLLRDIDANLAVEVVEGLSWMWQNDPELVAQLSAQPRPELSGG